MRRGWGGHAGISVLVAGVTRGPTPLLAALGHQASFPLVLRYKRNAPSRAQFAASEEEAIYLVCDFNTWHLYLSREEPHSGG